MSQAGNDIGPELVTRQAIIGNHEVRVFAGAPGGSSVATFYELALEKEIYADGAATVVFVGRDQKPLRIPDRIRSLMLEK